jgi:hypothetical protein
LLELRFNIAYRAVATAMDISNVDTVFIAGKVIRRGKLLGVDLARVQPGVALSARLLLVAVGHRPSRSVH